MNSEHHGKCQFAFKLLQLSTISYLFPLEVVQKVPMLSTLYITRNHEKLNWPIVFLLVLVTVSNFVADGK